MRHRILSWLVGAAAALAAGACAPAAGGVGGFEPAPADEVLVHVKNHNWADVAVYVVRDGVRTRLGTVTSMNAEVFRVPRAMLSPSADLRLLLDPIGSPDGYLTEPILVAPGQTVEMNVENNIRLTNWSVW